MVFVVNIVRNVAACGGNELDNACVSWYTIDVLRIDYFFGDRLRQWGG